MLAVRADLRIALAEVLVLAGQREEAARRAEEALDLYERKGHVPGAANARTILTGLKQPAT